MYVRYLPGVIENVLITAGKILVDLKNRKIGTYRNCVQYTAAHRGGITRSYWSVEKLIAMQRCRTTY